MFLFIYAEVDDAILTAVIVLVKHTLFVPLPAQ